MIIVFTEGRVVKSGQQYCVCCTYDGCRYHYWSEDPVALVPNSDTLFKNPPLHTPRAEETWFKPRRLRIARNRALVEAMRTYAVVNGLIEKADQDEAAGEAQRLQQQRERSMVHMVDAIKSYAQWDLQAPLDGVSDKDVLTALAQMISTLRQKVKKDA
jgi:hypothetical protein